MLISTHVLSGALLGRVLGRPLPALLIGAASHLALDRLPHWGRAGGWPSQPMQGEDFRVAVVWRRRWLRSEPAVRNSTASWVTPS